MMLKIAMCVYLNRWESVIIEQRARVKEREKNYFSFLKPSHVDFKPAVQMRLKDKNPNNQTECQLLIKLDRSVE